MDTEAIVLLIDELAAERVRLYVEGGALRHRAAPGALTPERQALLDAHHDEIRDVLRARSYVGACPPQVPEAQAVWAPTSAQLSVVNWSEPTLMQDIRPVPMLDRTAAQAALNEVIARHDALRTRFTKDDAGRYWAVTQQRVEVSIRYGDISELSAEERAAGLSEIMQAVLEVRFDLEAGPLLRLGLVKVSEREMLCVLSMCHSICDRISIEVFYRELLELHQALVSGTAPRLQPAPLFRDHVQQLHERLNSERGFDDFIYYWNRILGSALHFPRAAVLKASAAAARYRAVPSTPRVTSPARYRGISGQQLASLRNLARRERLTLFACALAAVGLALRSCARSDDSFVFLVQSARLTPPMAGMIGCCSIHSLFPMRFSNRQSLREVLHAVWQAYLEDMRHLLPAQELGPIIKRLFESGAFLGTEFNYERSEPPVQLPDVPDPNTNPMIFSVPTVEDGSVFRIRVSFSESERGLGWVVLHKSAAVEEEMAERFSILIETALVQMARDVDSGLALELPQECEALP